jgi:uncharacterized protein (TIGR02996 family)
MTTEADFLASIHADPADHLSYAVFGDWLEEQVDPRAALVRALLAERSESAGDSRSPRVAEVLPGLAGTVLRRVAGAGQIAADPDGLLRVSLFNVPPAGAPELPEWGWVTEIEITRLDVLRSLNEIIARLPLLRKVTIKPVPGQAVKWFRVSRNLATRPLAVRLDLSSNPRWDRGLERFGPLFPAGWLRELLLARCELRERDLARLLSLVGLEELRKLDLTYNQIDSRCVRLLAQATRLPNLESLSLSGNPVGDDDLEVLLATPHLPALRELRLDNTHLTLAGLRSWMRSRCGPEADRPFQFVSQSLAFECGPGRDGPFLEIRLNWHTPAGWVDQVAALPLPDEVVSLRLSVYAMTPAADVARLLTLPALDRVQRLTLGGPVSEDLLRAATSAVSINLTELSLIWWNFDLAALTPLLDVPLRALRVLRVPHPRLPLDETLLAALRDRIPVVEVGNAP